ncbi:MAG: uracil-DNA glycosylase [Bacteroidales bacterium]|nr:uracil-DNA glycosylase [Bacteroidales bacterium]MEE1203727.1 uracil-DNA glycosylase [Bacteroidales bacterium]
MNVTIEESWKRVLGSEFEKEYFKTLRDFIHSEYRNKIIYPPAKQIFNAFDSCPFESVKVVILGQDPYHEPSQAHGLSFSVLPPCPPPPSLVNIYKEIRSDVGDLVSANGDLTDWSRQGVLLLNATLTVEAHKAGSHQNKGWETFTDSAIKALAENREHLVFMLWGSYAQRKGAFIDRSRHLVLQAPHPSPLSAYRGFFGCKHFSAANAYLISQGLSPIVW